MKVEVGRGLRCKEDEDEPHGEGDLEGVGHDDALGQPDERRDGLVDRLQGADEDDGALGAELDPAQDGLLVFGQPDEVGVG